MRGGAGGKRWGESGRGGGGGGGEGGGGRRGGRGGGRGGGAAHYPNNDITSVDIIVAEDRLPRARLQVLLPYEHGRQELFMDCGSHNDAVAVRAAVVDAAESLPPLRL